MVYKTIAFLLSICIIIINKNSIREVCTMMYDKAVKCVIEQQKDSVTELELRINHEEVKSDGLNLYIREDRYGECDRGLIDLTFESEELSEFNGLAFQTPIHIYLPVDETPVSVTALYMFGSWWSRPAFVQKLSDIPDKTQVALFKYADRFACFVPTVGDRFKAYLTSGSDNGLHLVLSALYGGINEVHEPL